MMSTNLAGNRILYYALIFSMLVHFSIFVNFSTNKVKLPKPRLRPMEISYRPGGKSPTETQKQPKSQRSPSKPQEASSARMIQTTRALEEKKMMPNAKLLFNNQPNVAFLLKNADAEAQRFRMEKKQPSRVDLHSMERRITVPELKSEKINNPVYLSYYQIVRNRIKDRAYSNYSRSEEGEVYLTFVLNNKGALRQVNLVEEKTSANKYLRDVGLKSIQDSSPFPSFPKDLKYAELSFNVVISFELKN